jgi:5-oxoprolinase (ATP-hydrolysing)
MDGEHRDTAIYARDNLHPNDVVNGPCILFEDTGTTVVECGWNCTVNNRGCLILKRVVPKVRAVAMGTGGKADGSEGADPIKLEIFNNLFMACAEQMGVTLQNVSYSVKNIYSFILFLNENLQRIFTLA